MRARAFAGLLVAVVGLAGCGGTPSTTVTVTETAVAPASPDPSTPAPPESAPSASDVAPAAESEMVVVPDMVGQNYQDAQDMWRASGLVVLPGEDATGANRLPVLDSNWYVVAQTPAGGTEVPNGSSIQATVKKYTDD
ncbi:MAG: hypothetical protein B7C55_04620 [Actinomycetales bacterium mxb001]|nr:MAG: hypothetical protein B7C55_04620 [Actinomycetales bacterium mxb001]